MSEMGGTAGELKPDPRNARTHSKRQVEQIIASIKEFGFTNPILYARPATFIERPRDSLGWRHRRWHGPRWHERRRCFLPERYICR